MLNQKHFIMSNEDGDRICGSVRWYPDKESFLEAAHDEVKSWYSGLKFEIVNCRRELCVWVEEKIPVECIVPARLIKGFELETYWCADIKDLTK